MPAAFEISEVLVNGLKVPAIGKELFCSSRDPEREAKLWVSSIAPLVQANSQILILGLGAGFHLRQFIEQFPTTTVQVLELKSQLVERLPDLMHLAVNSILDAERINTRRIILEFRPAWLGHEDQYSKIQKDLLHQSNEAFSQAARAAGLSFTAVTKDFQIKALDWIFIQENQSEEVKIWRALRELVQ